MFSTLEDVRKHVPKGALPKRPNEHVVPHFESKDAVLVGAVLHCPETERTLPVRSSAIVVSSMSSIL